MSAYMAQVTDPVFVKICCSGRYARYLNVPWYLTLRRLMSYIYGAPILDVSRSHDDAPQSVGLLWTSDQLVAETSTWQHTTLTTDKYPCPRWDSNPRSQLRSWVPIPPGAWIFVCCECRVLSGRGLCYELITRPEESYRLCCVVVCDLET